MILSRKNAYIYLNINYLFNIIVIIFESPNVTKIHFTPEYSHTKGDVNVPCEFHEYLQIINNLTNIFTSE